MRKVNTTKGQYFLESGKTEPKCIGSFFVLTHNQISIPMKKNLHFYLFLLCPGACLTAQPVPNGIQVVNSIAWTQTPPAFSNVDVMHAVYYQYTIPQSSIVMSAIVKCNGNGSTINPITQAIINPTPATTETPVQVSGNLYIPQGTIPSAQLPNGQFYRWEASIRGAGNALVLGISSPLTIGAPLAANSFESKKLRLYPNPVAGLLYLPESLLNQKITINDCSGRVVFSGVVSGTLDASAFSPGVYVLHTETGSTAKFIKK